jgi:glycosyltransferase involved in cell wall biosynthesis
MNILYDMTVLCKGLDNETSKTGVHRVVEKVFEELYSKDEINIRFVCDYNSEISEQGKRYIKSKNKLSEDTLLVPEKKQVLQDIQSKKSEIIKKISHQKNIFNVLILKVHFKFLQLKNLFILNEENYSKKDLADFDIYHSPFHPIPNWIKQNPDLKYFITVYDLIPIKHPEYFTQYILDLFNNIIESLDFNTYIFCISQSTKNDLIEHCKNKIDPNKVFVTPLAASDLFYRVTDSTLIDQVLKKYSIPQKKYVLSLCTLEPRKNIISVIKAYASIVQKFQIEDLNLVLVGTKGWNFDKIFEEIDNLQNLRNRIIVTGFVDDSDLSAIYSNALVFVYPSFYEGFGLPPLEAMKCGIPVITSNNSSLPEVVGDAGFMIDANDLESLQHEILKIYNNDNYRSTLVSKSIIQSKYFSWENTAELVINGYKNAIVGL